MEVTATGATTPAGGTSGTGAASLVTPAAGATGSGSTPPPAAGATGSGSTDWTTGFNEDIKGYIATKGFKDPAQIVDSYRNLEKLMGVPKDRLLKLPDKEDAPEWSEIYGRLGRPDKPEGYGLQVPEGGNKEFAEWAAKNFHELGVTRKQGEALVTRWNEYQGKAATQVSEAQKQAMEQDRQTIRREWGAATEKNISIVDQAAAAFGLDGKTVEKIAGAIGVANTMRFMLNVGSRLGEDTFVQGNTGSKFGPLAPAAAKQRIEDLKKDSDFQTRYLKGDLQAREEMQRLHEYAYREES